jgi:hypothetical protein
MWQIKVRRDMCRGVWWGNMKEEDNLEDMLVAGRIILNWLLKI